MGDIQEEEKIENIPNARQVRAQENQGPLIRIPPDYIMIDKNMIMTRDLNNFAVKVFCKLPFGDKNHIICPVFLFSSFSKTYNQMQRRLKETEV